MRNFLKWFLQNPSLLDNNSKDCLEYPPKWKPIINRYDLTTYFHNTSYCTALIKRVLFFHRKLRAYKLFMRLGIMDSVNVVFFDRTPCNPKILGEWG